MWDCLAASHIDSLRRFAQFLYRLSRERSGPSGLGAEGATAPETLRQTDREGLINAGKQPLSRFALRRLAEGAKGGLKTPGLL